MKRERKENKQGHRAFYWTPEYKRPLCLQSRQYNLDRKGVTWVYYSEVDTKRLYRFLKEIFGK